MLPNGVEAVTQATVVSEAQDQISTGLGFLRTAFLVFAFVSLFVGAFIIFNTFSIILAQRTRELALFRALGASGRQVMTSVLVEAFVIGVVSSVVGVLVGIGIAILLKGALNATGFEIPASGTVILARTIVVSLVVGTLVTMIAAFVPARRAARVAPIEALREAQDRPGRSLRFRIVTGRVVLALGVAPLLYGLFGTPSNGLQLVGLGVALTFVGVAMLTPLIARPVAAAIGLPVRLTGVPGKLGRENSMRNPRRTAATASALMIGLGLVVFVAVFGASAKASTTAVLERTLKADFILISPTLTGFSTSAAEDARAVPGVDTVSQVRQAEAKIEGGTAFVTGLDPGTFPVVSEVDAVQGGLEDLANPNSIAVFDDTARENDWTVGDTIPVEFPATGSTSLRVVALYAENGLIGDYAISLDTFDVNVANVLDMFVLIKADEGADVATVQADLEEALAPYPNIEVDDQAGFRDRVRDVDQPGAEPDIRAAPVRRDHRVVRRDEHPVPVDLRADARARSAAGGGADAQADPLDGPVGGRDHLRDGGAVRRGDRDRVRLGAAAGARTRGLQRARHPRRPARDLRGVRRGPGRGLRDPPGPPGGQAERAGGHRVRVAGVRGRRPASGRRIS